MAISKQAISENKKALMIKAMRKYKLNISLAADEAQTTRTSHYNWIKTDRAYASAIKAIEKDILSSRQKRFKKVIEIADVESDREMLEEIKKEDIEHKIKSKTKRNIPCYIYFFEANGHVKIGTTKALEQRKAAIQSGCPYVINLVFLTEGGFLLEKMLFEKFKEYRTIGEWFVFSDEIKRFIRENKKLCLKDETYLYPEFLAAHTTKL